MPVVPRGAGSGLSGGAAGIDGGLTIALTRMNRVLEIDRENLTVTTQPGIVNADLKAAVAAARNDVRIGRATLDLLHREIEGWPGTWPAGATDELVALLLEGHRAIPVLEALDQRELFSRLLPEWEPVRSKPQRNAYHRFTVDRHLWEAAANAAAAVSGLAGR